MIPTGPRSLLPALALAAQAVITGYELRVYVGGIPTPVLVVALPAGSYRCQLTPAPPPRQRQAPQGLEWHDPDAPGRVCRAMPGEGGPLFRLPTGRYEAALRALTASRASAEGPRVSFVVGAP